VKGDWLQQQFVTVITDKPDCLYFLVMKDQYHPSHLSSFAAIYWL
jgi:hypothetical protein